MGCLNVGDISVLVVIGCFYCLEVFEVCCYIIDILKYIVFIWKKEYWVDGLSSWVSIGVCEIEN